MKSGNQKNGSNKIVEMNVEELLKKLDDKFLHYLFKCVTKEHTFRINKNYIRIKSKEEKKKKEID